jgi:hypothetical protein
VRTSSVDQPAQNTATASNTTAAASDPNTSDVPLLKPIDTTARTINVTQTADRPAVQPAMDVPKQTLQPADDAANPAKTTAPKASFRFASEMPTLKSGDKVQVAINVDGSAPFRSAVVGLKFDKNAIAVRSVRYGDIFGVNVAGTAVTPFLNHDGKMYVNLSTDKTMATGSGVVAYIEIEALMDGQPQIAFDKDALNLLTPDGKNFVVSF